MNGNWGVEDWKMPPSVETQAAIILPFRDKKNLFAVPASPRQLPSGIGNLPARRRGTSARLEFLNINLAATRMTALTLFASLLSTPKSYCGVKARQLRLDSHHLAAVS